MKSIFLLLCLLAARAGGVPLTLAWDANAQDEAVTGYVVYETLPDPATPKEVGTTVDTAITLDVMPGKHTYYVVAKNLWGESDASDPVSTPTAATITAGNLSVGTLTISP